MLLGQDLQATASSPRKSRRGPLGYRPSRADPQLFDDDLIDIHKTIRGIGVFVFEHTDL